MRLAEISAAFHRVYSGRCLRRELCVLFDRSVGHRTSPATLTLLLERPEPIYMVNSYRGK